jgi:hypothetical protein
VQSGLKSPDGLLEPDAYTPWGDRGLFFFGFGSGLNNIKMIDIFASTNNQYYSYQLDNFTYEQVSPAVPEPSTWAMMLLGFAGIGFMAYRRKSATLMAA